MYCWDNGSYFLYSKINISGTYNYSLGEQAITATHKSTDLKASKQDFSLRSQEENKFHGRHGGLWGILQLMTKRGDCGGAQKYPEK